ncbi:MAG: hypothetical protein IKW96_13245 [Ruminococcus sp.]|uniref:hypothetical protein n=1 Tax=Ruminococcus sp. TaxID=41978 RepID=UPI0025FD3B08|nr:hypothetical protein [Ruminococcus sp.]MBR5684213.1 hypothetical protein [Ruminococcus sp.]
MLIKLLNIEKRGSITVAECETGIGVFRGIWRSRQIKPVPGSTYRAELTLADISCDEVTKHSSGEEPFVYLQGDGVRFTAICEEYDGEVYFLRFAEDWLQMLYIEEDEQHFAADDVLSFKLSCEQVEVYPYSLP